MFTLGHTSKHESKIIYKDVLFLWYPEPFKRQPHKMVKHIQTTRWQIAGDLFVCLTILWGWRLNG